MDMADDGKKIETFEIFNIFGKMGVNEWKYDSRFHIWWHIGSVYGIFTYIYHKSQVWHVDEYTIHGLFGYGVVACFSFAH